MDENSFGMHFKWNLIKIPNSLREFEIESFELQNTMKSRQNIRNTLKACPHIDGMQSVLYEFWKKKQQRRCYN